MEPVFCRFLNIRRNKLLKKILDEDLIIKHLVFEITRKCNLNCIHCAKGHSQNITITKEIIDKTFDTLQNNKILSVEMFGGEPTLEPEMVEYIVDEIIKRKIKIEHFKIQTNGLVKNNIISNAMNRIGNYINTYYKGDKNVTMEISIEDHEKTEIANDGICFYRNNANEKVNILNQAERLENRKRDRKKEGKPEGEILYIYMGNAIDNYEILRKKHNFRIKDRRVAVREPGSNIIEDSLYICANGNVVNSTLESYELEDDKEYVICNILTDDLFEKINEWNFKYPLMRKQKKYEELCLTNIFNFENGITKVFTDNNEMIITKQIAEQSKEMIKFIRDIQELKRMCHKELPYINYDEFGIVSDIFLELVFDGKYLSTPISCYDCSNYIYDKEKLLDTYKEWEQINYYRSTGEEYISELNTIIKTITNIIKKYTNNTEIPSLYEIKLIIDLSNKIDTIYKEICKIDNIKTNEYRNNVIKIIEQNKNACILLIKRANKFYMN